MIVLIKLTTGEELAGEVDKPILKGSTITVYNPLKIIYKQSMEGIPITFVVRYQMFTKHSKVDIFNDHIISISEARETFVRYYEDAIRAYNETEASIDKQLSMLMGESSNSLFSDILYNMPKDSPIN